MMNLTNLSSLASLGLPEPAAKFAATMDPIWDLILWVTLFFFAIICGTLILFIIKYRRREGRVLEAAPTHHTTLELAWSIIPLIIVLAIFYIGAKGFNDSNVAPTNSYPVEVDAKKWNFSFTYPNGGNDGELWCVKDQPVRLIMTSEDVLHGFYVPAFRAHRNIVPGRVTEMWFQPTTLGDYNVFCTQYCGDGHSNMTTHVHVVDQKRFDLELARMADLFHQDGKPVEYADVGKRLYTQMGCVTCHSTDGARGQGPSWKNLYLYGQKLQPGCMQSGGQIEDVPGKPTDTQFKDWDQYLNRAIQNPGADVVETYQNIMPGFSAQLDGAPYNIKKRKAIIEYIKSLSDRYTPDVKKEDPTKPAPEDASTTAPATAPTPKP
jgi:cytochrome c oxidase subunit II